VNEPHWQDGSTELSPLKREAFRRQKTAMELDLETDAGLKVELASPEQDTDGQASEYCQPQPRWDPEALTPYFSPKPKHAAPRKRPMAIDIDGGAVQNDAESPPIAEPDSVSSKRSWSDQKERYWIQDAFQGTPARRVAFRMQPTPVNDPPDRSLANGLPGCIGRGPASSDTSHLHSMNLQHWEDSGVKIPIVARSRPPSGFAMSRPPSGLSRPQSGKPLKLPSSYASDHSIDYDVEDEDDISPLVMKRDRHPSGGASPFCDSSVRSCDSVQKVLHAGKAWPVRPVTGEIRPPQEVLPETPIGTPMLLPTGTSQLSAMSPAATVQGRGTPCGDTPEFWQNCRKVGV